MENMEGKLRELFKYYSSIEQINEAVYDTLKELLAIPSDIPVGTRLNCYDLATIFDVSRTPIQNALMRLEYDGLIRYDQKKGYLVYELTFNEARDYNEFSLGIYMISIQLAQRKMDNYYKRLIKTQLDQSERETDVLSYMFSDTEFHKLIAQSTGNEELIKTFSAITLKGNVIRLDKKIAREPSNFIQEHQPLNRKLYELIIGNDEAALAEFTLVHNAHMMTNMCNWLAK